MILQKKIVKRLLFSLPCCMAVIICITSCGEDKQLNAVQEERESSIDTMEEGQSINTEKPYWRDMEPDRVLEECNLMIYTRKLEENEKSLSPLEVTLVNENNDISYILVNPGQNYWVDCILPDFIFFAERIEGGTAVNIWEPHVLNKDTLQEIDIEIESPISFLDDNLFQVIEEDIITLQFKDYEIEVDYIWDKENNKGDSTYYGDIVIYSSDSNQLTCYIAIFQHISAVAEMHIPYLYCDGEFLIDEDNVTINLVND